MERKGLGIVRAIALPAFVCAAVVQAQQFEIRVTNPSDIDRTEEMIAVQWQRIIAAAPSFAPAHLTVTDATSNKELIVQTVDDNTDGIPEEILFRSDFKAGESKSFVLSKRESSPIPGVSLTDVRFVLPREDVAWENDRVAFRVYGPALAKDVSNGIDVWTKRVRYLIVEKWYKKSEGSAPGKDTYHEDTGEGADFFAVGRTLGAGSCALWSNDSLVQPGVFARYRIIAPGPLRAIFELEYHPVIYAGRETKEIKRISLDAGSNLNKIDVTYTGGTGRMVVAAGIVKRVGVTGSFDSKSHSVSLWGAVNDKAENGSLGTGIVLPTRFFREKREDAIHLLLLGTGEMGKPFTYYGGAGWTRSSDFATADDWNDYLAKRARLLNEPLRIQIVKR